MLKMAPAVSSKEVVSLSCMVLRQIVFLLFCNVIFLYATVELAPVAYAQNFHGGVLVQGHMVVIWCVLFVMPQLDVISMFPN